jgi:hypothetical protein
MADDGIVSNEEVEIETEGDQVEELPKVGEGEPVTTTTVAEGSPEVGA